MLPLTAMETGAHAAWGGWRRKMAALLGLALFLAAASAYCGDLAGPELTTPRLSPAMSNSLTEPEQPKHVAQPTEGTRMVAAEQARRTPANDIAGVDSSQSNVINATQSGSGNQVTATQSGKGNSLDLLQAGDANNARLTQQGGNRLTLEQVGMGNRADVQQMNGGPAITIRQTGGDSFIKATQY